MQVPPFFKPQRTRFMHGKQERTEPGAQIPNSLGHARVAQDILIIIVIIVKCHSCDHQPMVALDDALQAS